MCWSASGTLLNRASCTGSRYCTITEWEAASVSASLAAAEQAGLGERAAEVRAAVGSQVDDDDAAAGRHGISLQAILNRESRLGELIAVRSPRRWRGPACGRDRDLPASRLCWFWSRSISSVEWCGHTLWAGGRDAGRAQGSACPPPRGHVRERSSRQPRFTNSAAHNHHDTREVATTLYTLRPARVSCDPTDRCRGRVAVAPERAGTTCASAPLPSSRCATPAPRRCATTRCGGMVVAP